MSITMTVTDGGLNLARDGYSGANNPKLLYVAVGSGTNTPTNGDTILQTEVFRKVITAYTNGSTGIIIVTLYLAQTDAVGKDIEEIGIFGGNSASAALNSGVLVARALYPHGIKGNAESINLQCNIPVTRS